MTWHEHIKKTNKDKQAHKLREMASIPNEII
jgi:hypothetical protein